MVKEFVLSTPACKTRPNTASGTLSILIIQRLFVAFDFLCKKTIGLIQLKLTFFTS